MQIPLTPRSDGTPDHHRPWRPPTRLVGLLDRIRLWPEPPYRLA